MAAGKFPVDLPKTLSKLHSYLHESSKIQAREKSRIWAKKIHFTSSLSLQLLIWLGSKFWSNMPEAHHVHQKVWQSVQPIPIANVGSPKSSIPGDWVTTWYTAAHDQNSTPTLATESFTSTTAYTADSPTFKSWFSGSMLLRKGGVTGLQPQPLRKTPCSLVTILKQLYLPLDPHQTCKSLYFQASYSAESNDKCSKKADSLSLMSFLRAGKTICQVLCWECRNESESFPSLFRRCTGHKCRILSMSKQSSQTEFYESRHHH